MGLGYQPAVRQHGNGEVNRIARANRQGTRPLSRFQGVAVHQKLIILCFALTAALLGLLVAAYREIISPLFAYQGLVWRDFEWSFWLLAIVVAAIPLFLVPLDTRRPSDWTVWVLYTTVVLPCCFIPSMVGGASPQYALLTIALPLVGCLVLVDLVRRGSTLGSYSGGRTLLLFRMIFPALALLVAGVIFFKYAGGAVNLRLDDVYTRRLEARDIITGGSIMAYVRAFAMYVLIPYLAALAVLTKRVHFVIPIGLLSVAVISFDGQKFVLFIPLVYVAVALAAQKVRENHRSVIRRTIVVFLTGACTVIAVGLAEEWVFGTRYIAVFVVRSLFIIPAHLTTYYYDFWSTEPYVWLSDGVLGRLGIVERVYPMSAPRMIGLTYFGNDQSNPNANIWASGFAHFGYSGMLAASVIAGGLLRVLDAISLKHGFSDRYVAGAVLGVMFGFAWSGSALQTSLFSNGIAPALALLCMFPDDIGIRMKTGGRRANSPAGRPVPRVSVTTPNIAMMDQAKGLRVSGRSS